MEDIILMQFLKKKGVITDRDLHEFHELASANIEAKPMYYSVMESPQHSDDHMSEHEARELVAKMYHMEGGRKYIGEKFDMYKAKEVCQRYRGILPVSVNTFDVYAAINSHYHNYAELFKSWFGDDIEHKIIESAIVYWFKDDDHMNKHRWFKNMDKY